MLVNDFIDTPGVKFSSPEYKEGRRLYWDMDVLLRCDEDGDEGDLPYGSDPLIREVACTKNLLECSTFSRIESPEEKIERLEREMEQLTDRLEGEIEKLASSLLAANRDKSEIKRKFLISCERKFAARGYHSYASKLRDPDIVRMLLADIDDVLDGNESA